MYLMRETIGKGCPAAVSKRFRGMKSEKTAKNNRVAMLVYKCPRVCFFLQVQEFCSTIPLGGRLWRELCISTQSGKADLKRTCVRVSLRFWRLTRYNHGIAGQTGVANEVVFLHALKD
jgi:hypothetical protein